MPRRWPRRRSRRSRSGRTRFVPKQYENIYFEWMRNIQPWCISRQLWWGHQIPAWYGPDGEVFVAMDAAEAADELAADPLWASPWSSCRTRTCSTPGSRQAFGRSRPSAGRTKTPELDRYYPTDVLVTGFDIIFFWVARMMMLGLKFMNDVPFRDVYIHGLVRDERGQKMSKVQGQCHRPLGSDREIRRRCASLHHPRQHRPGPRHQIR